MLPLLPPTFLGMGVVGDGLFDTGFFLVVVAVVVVLLLTGVDLLSPVLDFACHGKKHSSGKVISIYARQFVKIH